jgi:hypothetical protein
MDAPIEEKPAAELRDYFAEERTFLAWICTGSTLMGFGFVVARFGICLEMMQVTRGELGPHPTCFRAGSEPDLSSSASWYAACRHEGIFASSGELFHPKWHKSGSVLSNRRPRLIR